MHVRDARKAARLVEKRPVTFLVFDVMRRDGHDLSRLPLSARREVLADLDLVDVHWQVPPAYDDGEMLLESTDQQGLAGIVSKRLASRYDFGARSPPWLKFPHRRRTSGVMGGWRPETGSDHRVGSVLVGEPTSQGLVLRGRDGRGLAGASGVRRRWDVAGVHRPAGPRGDRLQATRVPLRLRGAQPALAQVPAPAAYVVGDRWVAPRDRFGPPGGLGPRRGADQPGSGLSGKGRERHRGQGRAGAQGDAGTSGAQGLALP